ncbi:hypothetical protein ACROYT_G013258 [Oculina patagonica]
MTERKKKGDASFAGELVEDFPLWIRFEERLPRPSFCITARRNNVDDGTIILYYNTSRGSPWIHQLSEAEAWLKEKEEARLGIDNIERPSTKWIFKGFSAVDVKVVLDRQPPLGTGPLLDWLRNRQATVALNTYRDNLCLWQCIAIGSGFEPKRQEIDKDPAELIHKFMEELERWGENIREKVLEEFMTGDVKMLPKKQRELIEQWCHEVPVVSFNSGRYDLNLIGDHFVERVGGGTAKVKVAKSGNKIMFIVTNGFRLLDIINYLGPGTSYEKWVKLGTYASVEIHL